MARSYGNGSTQRDIATALFGRRAGSAIGAFGEGGTAAVGTLVVGLTFGLQKLSSSLTDLGKTLDKALTRLGPDPRAAQTGADLAAAITKAPTAGTFGGTSKLGDFANFLGVLTDPKFGFLKAGVQLFGPKAETGPQQMIDSMSLQDLYAALPYLTGDAAKYAQKKLQEKVGHVGFEARAGQAFAASPYGQQITAANITVNSPIGDRNAIGLAAKAAIDAHDRNNGRYAGNSTFTRG